MFRTTVKTLLARKLRLVTTGLAVLLGVAFMAGTLVLTDTIGHTFDNLFANVYGTTDAVVRAPSTFEAQGQDQRPRVPAGLVEQVASVPGVAAAEGGITGYAQLIDKEGKAVGDPQNGAPPFGTNWSTVEALNPFPLAEGRSPTADDEVVIDRNSAKKAGYHIGDKASVLVQGPPQQVTIVGIAKFGEADSPGGASFVMFTTPAAQRVIAQPAQFDSINVLAKDGVSQEQVRANIAKALPSNVEVVTGATVVAEQQSAIKEGLKFFNTFLLTFALI